ncbi:MAG: hypothetical protein mread185_000233 [Mycoplasmataceae bacterium]|nr:MAG: hypothetical protein mread185_000233 [Mycoplasmataceae bacterium]
MADNKKIIDIAKETKGKSIGLLLEIKSFDLIILH